MIELRSCSVVNLYMGIDTEIQSTARNYGKGPETTGLNTWDYCMKVISFNSIRQEILFFGAIALIIVAFAIIGYAGLSLYGTSVENSFTQVKAISVEESLGLKAEIDRAFELDRTLAGSINGSLEVGKKPSREEVQAMVYGLMLRYPQYNGIYIVMEPDIWDGKDKEYAGKPGTDSSGRFMAYYDRDIVGNPKIDAVYNYSEGEDGSDYYVLPKKTLKDYVTEPYPWDIQGRKILLTSVVVPILYNNMFVGIAGVDLPLENVQGFADGISAYNGTSKIYYLSNGGVITGATGYPDSVGTSIKDGGIPLSSQYETVLNGILSARDDVKEVNGEIIAFTPLLIGNSGNPWSVILSVPVDVVTAKARGTTIVLILIGTFFTLIGLGLLLFIARGLASPIEQITAYADSIAEGELGGEITIFRADEIGRLADSFRRLLSSLQGKALAADGIAAGDLSVTIPLSSEHDVLGRSMIMMRDTIRQMAGTVTDLSHKASMGDLQVRGDVSRYQGEYKSIIGGINETLEAVISPINGTMDLADVYASGDYTATFDSSIKVSGSFSRLRDSLNHIGEQNASAVQGVKRQIESVAANIQETTASLEEVSASSAKLASSSNEVSILAETSQQGVQQILQAMDDLSVNISHVAEMTDTLASLSHSTDELSLKGSDLARKAEVGMQDIISSIGDTSQTITKMTSGMDEIGQIVKLISEIADQTNLLSLNAAIEAARAGDAGRGFAVVANEVKALAIQSQISADKIGVMISALQRQSTNASQAMERSSNDVNTGNTAVRETLGLFSQIVTHIQDISEHVSSVASAAEEQAAAVQEITASVHELGTHVNKTSEEAVSSAAATEETAAALDQISRSISEVAGASDRIIKEMGRFKVN